MDIKEQIEAAVKKITGDEKLKKQFADDPVKAVESAVGVDLPDDAVNKVVAAVKAKLGADKLGGAVDALKKLF